MSVNFEGPSQFELLHQNAQITIFNQLSYTELKNCFLVNKHFRSYAMGCLKRYKFRYLKKITEQAIEKLQPNTEEVNKILIRIEDCLSKGLKFF